MRLDFVYLHLAVGGNRAGLYRSLGCGCLPGGPRDTERLAWKARQQHVVPRDFLARQLGDVPVDGMFTPEIREVGLLRILVPLASEDTGPSNRIESDSQTADACEQVNEVEWVGLVRGCPSAHALCSHRAQSAADKVLVAGSMRIADVMVLRGFKVTCVVRWFPRRGEPASDGNVVLLISRFLRRRKRCL